MRKDEVVAEVENFSLLEKISWKKNSRALWLKEGNKCTKFFHHMANSHRKNNAIEVHQSGDCIDLLNHIVNFYEKLFSGGIHKETKT